MHFAYQIPAYILLALSEILTADTGLEHAHLQAPASLRPLTTAIFLLTFAFGSVLSAGLASVSVYGMLMWTFIGLGGVSFLTGVMFWALFASVDKPEKKLGKNPHLQISSTATSPETDSLHRGLRYVNGAII